MHLHLQNSIYLNFLHLQRNNLPKIIDFKFINKGNNSTQVSALRRIHFNFLSNLLEKYNSYVQNILYCHMFIQTVNKDDI